MEKTLQTIPTEKDFNLSKVKLAWPFEIALV